MTTIIDPSIFNRHTYNATDAMKEVLADYGLTADDVEPVITSLGLAARGAPVDLLRDSLADTVHIRSGDEKQVLKAEKALAEFGKLAGMKWVPAALYDEGQMIFKSEAIGLANGLAWIGVRCTATEIMNTFVGSYRKCAKFELRLIALNLVQ
jgi:hypothetical protein